MAVVAIRASRLAFVVATADGTARAGRRQSVLGPAALMPGRGDVPRSGHMARVVLLRLDMSRSLNFADVAVRPEGGQWVVVDHADRRVLEQRFSDRFSAISLGLLVASQQGGALWIDELDEPAPAETSRVVYH